MKINDFSQKMELIEAEICQIQEDLCIFLEKENLNQENEKNLKKIYELSLDISSQCLIIQDAIDSYLIEQ